MVNKGVRISQADINVVRERRQTMGHKSVETPLVTKTRVEVDDQFNDGGEMTVDESLIPYLG